MKYVAGRMHYGWFSCCGGCDNSHRSIGPRKYIIPIWTKNWTFWVKSPRSDWENMVFVVKSVIRKNKSRLDRILALTVDFLSFT